ncbi:NADH dehydrogenase [Desulforamulus aquiferis]|nr:NAD(P)H-dependent oxidoreductase subunit E [Desulforamulus aquiferis]RYD03665.1 NADH dehydrogenase [Desulforamulus aquiferis]
MKTASQLSKHTSSSPLAIIDQIVRDHNLDEGSAIVILQQIQAAFGYVGKPMLERVSQLTGIPASVLYSIVTFYTQFRLEPVGENFIQVCHGTACHLAGAERISEVLQQETGVPEGKTSADGKFTVKKVACLGCCSLGPVVTVNEETFARVTPDKARQMIKEKRASCQCGHSNAEEVATID